MQRNIHFIAGLPRSGSTLLCNLLAQNPRFHTTSTSGVITVVRTVFENWKTIFGTDTHPQSIEDRRRVVSAAKGGDLADTPSGRCQFWLQADQPLGLAINRIADALHRGYRDRMLFVPYERLTRQPASVLTTIPDFLGEERFRYNFDEIQHVCSDVDEMYPIPELAPVRPKLIPSAHTWPEILGAAAEVHASRNALWSSKAQL